MGLKRENLDFYYVKISPQNAENGPKPGFFVYFEKILNIVINNRGGGFAIKVKAWNSLGRLNQSAGRCRPSDNDAWSGALAQAGRSLVICVGGPRILETTV